MPNTHDRYQDGENQNPLRIRDMLKDSGHEFSPLQEPEKYSESENPSSTRIRDMLIGKEAPDQTSDLEQENENENE